MNSLTRHAKHKHRRKYPSIANPQLAVSSTSPFLGPPKPEKIAGRPPAKHVGWLGCVGAGARRWGWLVRVLGVVTGLSQMPMSTTQRRRKLEHILGLATSTISCDGRALVPGGEGRERSKPGARVGTLETRRTTLSVGTALGIAHRAYANPAAHLPIIL